MKGDARSRLSAWSARDFEEGADAAARDRKLLAVVSAVAFAMLLLELLLTRMYPFFLGDVTSFVAIPVAMSGLSVGALALHLARRPVSAADLPALLVALGVAMPASFFALFLLFDHVFGLTHHQLQSPPHDALKTAVLSLIFVPPFALAGAILSVAFRAGSAAVGRLYAADLAGSALACAAGPVVLHLTDLPVALCVPLWALFGAHVVVFSAVRARLLGVGLPVMAGLTALAWAQLVFVEHPDPDVLGVRYSEGHVVTEHAHRWNDISRVALVSWEKPGEPATWRVMHDDGVSNVVVLPFAPELVDAPPADGVHGLPFLLDRPPKDALVLFAGTGRDMIKLHRQAHGDLRVTGVELNGLVPALAVAGGDPFHLQAFYDRPEVELVVAEGRSWLDRDPDHHDLVFLGANGAQTAARTGHARKFLDTVEATEAVLDHLAPDGLVVYFVQPFGLKLEILARLSAERGLPPLSQTTIVVGSKPNPRPDGTDTLLFKPSGFTPGEVERIRAAAQDERLVVHQSPGRTSPGLRGRLLGAPHAGVRLPTDDRPYERELRWSAFRPFPSAADFDDLAFSLDWIKIFTTILFVATSALVLVGLHARRRVPIRLPPWATGWFVVSGLAYMFAEIGLMAKLELFLGSPLLSVSAVLASFLLANAAGSAWVGRAEAAGRPLSPAVPGGVALLLLAPTVAAVEGLARGALAWPVAAKLPAAIAAVAPFAAVLGTFYPVGVGLLYRRGLAELVPATFGLATVSAVVGSTVALVAAIDVGGRALLGVAGLLYGVLAVAALAGRPRAG